MWCIRIRRRQFICSRIGALAACSPVRSRKWCGFAESTMQKIWHLHKELGQMGKLRREYRTIPLKLDRNGIKRRKQLIIKTRSRQKAAFASELFLFMHARTCLRINERLSYQNAIPATREKQQQIRDTEKTQRTSFNLIFRFVYWIEAHSKPNIYRGLFNVRVLFFFRLWPAQNKAFSLAFRPERPRPVSSPLRRRAARNSDSFLCEPIRHRVSWINYNATMPAKRINVKIDQIRWISHSDKVSHFVWGSHRATNEEDRPLAYFPVVKFLSFLCSPHPVSSLSSDAFYDPILLNHIP